VIERWGNRLEYRLSLHQHPDPAKPVRTRYPALLVCAAAALLATGCVRSQEAPPSLKDVPAVKGKPDNMDKAEVPKEDVRDWCAKRHADREQGRPPGGAPNREQLEKDNRVCGELYRYPGYLEP
jgi:hypothetical protein